MARLGCRCGNALSSTNVPSPNLLHIYSVEEVNQAIAECPEKLLLDYQTDYIGPEYWYCPICKRVYEVEATPQGQATAVYHETKGNPASDSSKLSAWYVLSDKAMYDAEEEDFNLTIKDFFHSLSCTSIYYTDEQKSHVYHKNENEEALHQVYEKED